MESPTFLDSRVSDRVPFFSQNVSHHAMLISCLGWFYELEETGGKKKETNTKMTKLFFPFLRQAFIVSSRDFCYVS